MRWVSVRTRGDISPVPFFYSFFFLANWPAETLYIPFAVLVELSSGSLMEICQNLPAMAMPSYGRGSSDWSSMGQMVYFPGQTAGLRKRFFHCKATLRCKVFNVTVNFALSTAADLKNNCN
jgi:hypothetical protein